MVKIPFNEQEILCLTESLSKKLDRESHANKIYRRLMQYYGLRTFSGYDDFENTEGKILLDSSEANSRHRCKCWG
jgi:hypothetical protein